MTRSVPAALRWIQYQILACCVGAAQARELMVRTEARERRFYVHRGDAYRSTPVPVLHRHAILIATDDGNEVGRVRHCFRNS